MVNTALMYTDECEDLCSNDHGCKGRNNIDLHSRLEKEQEVADPEITKSPKHTFDVCDDPDEYRRKRKPPRWRNGSLTEQGLEEIYNDDICGSRTDLKRDRWIKRTQETLGRIKLICYSIAMKTPAK